jgi:hypothetical protein
VIPSSAGGFRRTRPVSRCLLILLACVPLAAQGQESGAGAVAANRYRNLFVEAGTSKEEVKRKVNTAFQQLFHGDPKTEAIYYAAGKNANGDLAYIVDVIHNDVRSEGMSYGMMIAVQLDKRREFDAIWNWARTYMFRNEPGHPARGFFSWSMKVDGTPNDETPAPDGEEYFAMALYFAAGRWGAGSGIYNYRAEADRLLADMLHREVVTGTTKRGPHTSGNMFEEKYKMVRFVPGLDRNGFTDPSYHLPAFYELWALWGPPADRPFWAQAAEASRDFFQKATNPLERGRRKLPLRRMAHGHELVCRLGLVGQGSSRAATERSLAGLLRGAGDRHLREPVHARRQTARRLALAWPGRDERRRQPCRDQPAREGFCAGVVEDADSIGTGAILRWDALPSRDAALQRRVPRLGPDERGGEASSGRVLG